jgi:hypothetical protein
MFIKIYIQNVCVCVCVCVCYGELWRVVGIPHSAPFEDVIKGLLRRYYTPHWRQQVVCVSSRD